MIVAVAGIGFSGQWVFRELAARCRGYDQAMTGERTRCYLLRHVALCMTKFTGALGIAVCDGCWTVRLCRLPAAAIRTALLGIRLFFGAVAAGVLIIACRC